MNISNLRLIVLISLTLISTVSYSQNSLRPGYIVNLKGDTIRGLVNYRNWEKNPKKISFSNDSGRKDYFPSDIKEFSAENEIYISAIVSVEDSPFKPEDITYTEELSFRQDTCFLQVVVEGAKSLYYYKDENAKQHYFIKGKSGLPELLLYKQYKIKTDAGIFIQENKKYIQQLSQYIEDCPAIASSLRKLSYSGKSLRNLFDAYYQCKGEAITYKKKTDKGKVEIGAIAGAVFTGTKFQSDADPFEFLDKSDFSGSTNFSGGIYFDITLSRSLGRWSVYNEILYSSYKTGGSYTVFNNPEYYTDYNTTIAPKSVKINNLIRYKIPVSGFFLYLNAGIANGFVLSAKNELLKHTKFYSTEETETLKVLNPLRKHYQELVTGIGAKYGRYSLEARAAFGNGLADPKVIKSSTSAYAVFLGYRFN